ncbi:conserved protein, unknown function [Hepatocystis sp. ex Piliocolobus tephrosceles]|nr:conserved protein, unknown function [Hepatocystis sp. ex Piliocolobus tephrosceles]
MFIMKKILINAVTSSFKEYNIKKIYQFYNFILKEKKQIYFNKEDVIFSLSTLTTYINLLSNKIEHKKKLFENNDLHCKDKKQLTVLGSSKTSDEKSSEKKSSEKKSSEKKSSEKKSSEKKSSDKSNSTHEDNNKKNVEVLKITKFLFLVKAYSIFFLNAYAKHIIKTNVNASNESIKHYIYMLNSACLLYNSRSTNNDNNTNNDNVIKQSVRILSEAAIKNVLIKYQSSLQEEQKKMGNSYVSCLNELNQKKTSYNSSHFFNIKDDYYLDSHTLIELLTVINKNINIIQKCKINFNLFNIFYLSLINFLTCDYIFIIDKQITAIINMNKQINESIKKKIYCNMHNNYVIKLKKIMNTYEHVHMDSYNFINILLFLKKYEKFYGYPLLNNTNFDTDCAVYDRSNNNNKSFIATATEIETETTTETETATEIETETTTETATTTTTTTTTTTAPSLTSQINKSLIQIYFILFDISSQKWINNKWYKLHKWYKSNEQINILAIINKNILLYETYFYKIFYLLNKKVKQDTVGNTKLNFFFKKHFFYNTYIYSPHIQNNINGSLQMCSFLHFTLDQFINPIVLLTSITTEVTFNNISNIGNIKLNKNNNNKMLLYKKYVYLIILKNFISIIKLLNNISYTSLSQNNKINLKQFNQQIYNHINYYNILIQSYKIKQPLTYKQIYVYNYFFYFIISYYIPFLCSNNIIYLFSSFVKSGYKKLDTIFFRKINAEIFKRMNILTVEENSNTSDYFTDQLTFNNILQYNDYTLSFNINIRHICNLCNIYTKLKMYDKRILNFIQNYLQEKYVKKNILKLDAKDLTGIIYFLGEIKYNNKSILSTLSNYVYSNIYDYTLTQIHLICSRLIQLNCFLKDNFIEKLTVIIIMNILAIFYIQNSLTKIQNIKHFSHTNKQTTLIQHIQNVNKIKNYFKTDCYKVIHSIKKKEELCFSTSDINLNSTNLNSTNINSTNLNSTNINSTNINSTNINSTNINSTNINSTNLNSTNLNSTNLNSTNINSTNINSTNFNSTNFNSTNFNIGIKNENNKSMFILKDNIFVNTTLNFIKCFNFTNIQNNNIILTDKNYKIIHSVINMLNIYPKLCKKYDLFIYDLFYVCIIQNTNNGLNFNLTNLCLLFLLYSKINYKYNHNNNSENVFTLLFKQIIQKCNKVNIKEMRMVFSLCKHIQTEHPYLDEQNGYYCSAFCNKYICDQNKKMKNKK